MRSSIRYELPPTPERQFAEAIALAVADHVSRYTSRSGIRVKCSERSHDPCANADTAGRTTVDAKSYSRLAAIIFAIIAVLQLARAVSGWEIAPNGAPIPLWPSCSQQWPLACSHLYGLPLLEKRPGDRRQRSVGNSAVGQVRVRGRVARAYVRPIQRPR